jgi:hypothetical protein
MVDLREVIFREVGTAFILASFLNSFWFVLWEKDFLLLASLMMFFVHGTVTYIYYNMIRNFPPCSWPDKLFIHAPFSMWHAWSLVVLVLTLFAEFTSVSDPLEPSTGITVAAIFVMIFLTLTAVGYTEFPEGGDLIGAWVVAWSLFAIAAEQRAPVIHWMALIFGCIIVVYSFKPLATRLLTRRRGASDDEAEGENAPLLV